MEKETYNIADNKEVLMNVAFFLRPKFQVVYMYENDSIRAGLEKMKYHGYTSIPVINEKNEYGFSTLS